MPWILRDLPFYAEDSIAFVRDEVVQVKAYEIIVWVSLSVREVLDSGRLLRFPAVLDTAHTHNFSILEEQLLRWAGLRLPALPSIGLIRQAGRRIPLHSAKLWLHPNRPGQRDQFTDQAAYRLSIPDGIAVYPAGTPFPRLPLLGMRTIARNKLRLAIDGERLRLSLRSPGRWDWLSRWLP